LLPTMFYGSQEKGWPATFRIGIKCPDSLAPMMNAGMKPFTWSKKPAKNRS